ncbi:putative MFS-type transporter YdeG [Streptomyces cacaoi]|uniref:Putative MFS-type transporter YdeG n=2 Tax=Streptomyces cacaoi TaxID=1898 RepID=A0A4Y3R2G5_STRCI|nr:MFS transporter [Streptomyces cacaoi]GEB51722.1 putative MFS-type transporter YdeG [Streptomyces cacaoi]
MTDMHEQSDAADRCITAPAGIPGTGRAAAPWTGPGLDALRRRVQTVLVVSQILGGLGVATAVTLAAVLAEEIGGSEAVAGLASTSSVIGTALLSLPFAALMARRGRRVGLTVAYSVAAAGGLVVVAAATVANFPLLLAGMAAFGAGSSANLQARFAAADLAAPARRARSISTVVWATTIGAVLGPNIAAPAGRSVAGLGIPQAAGAFVWGTVVFVLAGLLVHLLLRPDPLLVARELAAREPEAPDARRADAAGEGRSLRAGLAAVAGSRSARTALVAIAGSHTVMVSVMVMTPVDLGAHGAGVQLIGLVISGHVTGMYAFSPVMGWLADRIGRFSVLLVAVALFACATALAGTADGAHLRSAAGLFLLGLGWSAGLVAGSALLTDSVPQPARAAVQGLSDLLMNACAGVGGALAGIVVAQAGYGWLNVGAAAVLVLVAGLTVLTLARRG